MRMLPRTGLLLAGLALVAGGALAVVALPAGAAATPLSQGQPATAPSIQNARHAPLGGGRRQQRYPVVERVQRSTVDPGGPRRDRHRVAGGTAVGGGVRVL